MICFSKKVFLYLSHVRIPFLKRTSNIIVPTTNRSSKNVLPSGFQTTILRAWVFRYQNAGQNHDVKIGSRSFENVAQFRYLGTTITNQNLIQEKI
jgi:hypothetical protein